MSGGASIDSTIRLIKEESREPTSGLEPLTRSHYECAVSGCWALHEFAKPACLKGFQFCRLPGIAGCCVRVRVKWPPAQERGLELPGKFGVSKPNRESRRADSNRFPAHYE